MAKVAEDLCNIQEYVRYKELMKGIRYRLSFFCLQAQENGKPNRQISGFPETENI
jgi:hypothetical protein